MKNFQNIVKGSVLMGLFALASGCIVAEPRDGYYERDHHRYYREHSWHECHEHDQYCR
jgi:hypothetical protein